MAEGLLKAMFGDLLDVSSAGTNPTKINPYAVLVLKEIGIDISGQQSKNLNEFRDKKIDIVVTVCDSVRDSCPFFPGGRIIHRGFQDPSVVGGTEEEELAAFRKSRDEIGDWIKEYFTLQWGKLQGSLD